MTRMSICNAEFASSDFGGAKNLIYTSPVNYWEASSD